MLCYQQTRLREPNRDQKPQGHRTLQKLTRSIMSPSIQQMGKVVKGQMIQTQNQTQIEESRESDYSLIFLSRPYASLALAMLLLYNFSSFSPYYNNKVFASKPLVQHLQHISSLWGGEFAFVYFISYQNMPRCCQASDRRKEALEKRGSIQFSVSLSESQFVLCRLSRSTKKHSVSFPLRPTESIPARLIR